MHFKHVLIIGIILTCGSLLSMLYLHEFTVSTVVFIIGIVVSGVAYDKIKKDGAQSGMNQISENIQLLNNVLWGEDKK